MERRVSFQLTVLGHRSVFAARESRQVSLHCKGVKTNQPSLQGSQDRSAFAARESRQVSLCYKGVKTGQLLLQGSQDRS